MVWDSFIRDFHCKWWWILVVPMEWLCACTSASFFNACYFTL